MAVDRFAVFLDALRTSKLLEPVQWEEAVASAPARAGDLQGLAKLLFQKGWLTRFQLNQLVQGRCKALTMGPYRLLELLGEGGWLVTAGRANLRLWDVTAFLGKKRLRQP